MLSISLGFLELCLSCQNAFRIINGALRDYLGFLKIKNFFFPDFRISRFVKPVRDTCDPIENSYIWKCTKKNLEPQEFRRILRIIITWMVCRCRNVTDRHLKTRHGVVFVKIIHDGRSFIRCSRATFKCLLPLHKSSSHSCQLPFRSWKKNRSSIYN